MYCAHLPLMMFSFSLFLQATAARRLGFCLLKTATSKHNQALLNTSPTSAKATLDTNVHKHSSTLRRVVKK
jgi:hypothetical protein